MNGPAEVPRIRLEWLSPTRFLEEFLLPSRPVIFQLPPQERMLRWTAESLCERFRERKVEIAQVFFDFTQHVPFASTEMTLGEYAPLLHPKDDKRSYLSQQSIPHCFPELVEELWASPFYEPTQTLDTNLWLGPPGTFTPVHFDVGNNFLVQVSGRKHVTLFAPSDYARLYPRPPSHDAFVLGQVKVRQPDLEAHPRFAEATPLRMTLSAGDVLYIPPFWWHEVESLDRAVSVNTWWHARLKQFLVPAYFAIAAQAPERCQQLDEFLDLREFSGPLDAARFVSTQGAPWLGVLIAEASLAKALEGTARERAPFSSGQWDALLERARAGEGSDVREPEAIEMISALEPWIRTLPPEARLANLFGGKPLRPGS